MSVRQYIGARYVTKIYENSLDPSSAEWEQGTFDPLVMVTWQNSTYLSKKQVPGSVGNPADNPNYWVVTGYYNGQIMQLQNDVSDIYSKIAHVNEPVNILSLGAKNDGSEDISIILQNAIDTYNIIYMPAGVYKLDSGVNLADGTIIYGDGCNVWSGSNGTQINCAAGITAFTGNAVKSVIIKDLTFNNPGMAIDFDGGSFNFIIENVTVYQSTVYAVHVGNGWAYNIKHVRAEGGATGFKLEEGTCVTVESCIAYGCTVVGFDCASVAGSFIACDTDASVTAYKFGDDNKITMVACGAEGATNGCIICDGVSSHLTAIDLAFGPHTDMLDYMVSVKQNFQAEFINIRLGSNKIPAAPYGVFDIASTATVTIENCYVATRSGNIPGNVTIVGGDVRGYTPGLVAPAFTTKSSSDTITAHGTSGVIATLELNATYLVCSGVSTTSSNGGISLISINNDAANAVITVLQGTIIVCHVASNGDLTLESTSSYDGTYNTSIIRIR